MPLSLKSPVSSVKGVGKVFSEKLADAGIKSVSDLLGCFPEYYIDLRTAATAIEDRVPQLYEFIVQRLQVNRNFRRRLTTLTMWGTIAGEKVRVLVFNRAYLARQLKKDAAVWLFGSIRVDGDLRLMLNPRLYFKKPCAIEPEYRSAGGVSAGRLRGIVRQALLNLEAIEEPLPRTVLQQHHWLPLDQALRRIHLPENVDPEHLAWIRERFVYQEFLEYNLELQTVRKQFRSVPRRRHYSVDRKFQALLKKSLPFVFTLDQTRAVEDVINDLKSAKTMQRLVQGDVGTGKTAVAFTALLLAVSSGFQGAFLAPTEILSRQHLEKAQQFFSGFRVAWLTGSTSGAERRKILEGLARNEIHLVFGTHALLNEKVVFHDLGMAVIDEQQRFGVAQRGALYFKSHAVDLLVTTATPIPRTLMLSLYNDLEVSVIKSRPAGRKPVRTRYVPAGERNKFYCWLQNRPGDLKKNDSIKIFVVMPLISSSERLSNLCSLENEGQELAERFSFLGTALLSSDTPTREREKIIADFRQGKLKMIVCTTVIELGLDVPDATVMIIENADRFGLAQLHQLRGRVGRGAKASTCYLLGSQKISSRGLKRLKTMERTGDGFEIAEMDLKMRGAGEIIGLRQSGFWDFRYGDVSRDRDILEQSRLDAVRFIENPDLQTRHLRELIASVCAKDSPVHFS